MSSRLRQTPVTTPIDSQSDLFGVFRPESNATRATLYRPNSSHIVCRCLVVGLVVFPVPVELSAGRGTVARARHRRLLRNDTAMGPQIRDGLCQAVAQKEAVARGYLAYGRGRDFNRRSKTLALARGRPGRLRSRRDCSEPPRYQGCQAIAVQASEEAVSATEAHDHRQTALVRRSKTGCNARRRTSIAQGPKQSHRELSRAAPKTRADDAGLPIRRKLATFHLGLFNTPESFRPAAPEPLSSRHLHLSHPRHRAVESRDRRNCVSSLENALSGIRRTT